MRSIIAGLAICAALAAACTPRPVEVEPSADGLIVSTQAVRPYAEAVKVRLLVHDRGNDQAGERVYSKPAGRILNDAERIRFEAAFKRVTIIKRPSSGGPSVYSDACFIPHHFFQYLDAAGTVIGEIAVCFCCENAQTQPRLPFEERPGDYLETDMKAVRAFVASLGLPTDIGCGKPSA